MADRIDPHSTTHDPRDCNLCASLRHPAQAVQGRALAKHLKTNPLPRQAVNA